MSISFLIQLNPNLFLRDPQDTTLGKQILKESISLFDNLGFEKFTFKKLSQRIGSTEASIYRYFENKHLLLLYLVSWYWEWLSFRIELATTNMEEPEDKIRVVIKTIVETIQEPSNIEYIDHQALHQIIISEGGKAYHTKEVDEENKKGFFLSYKNLVQQISNIILELNPNFKYPYTLATNILEMTRNHIYFAQHLPRLTDIHVEGDNLNEVSEMLEYFAFKLIKD
jgi:AcrR family transcriptional regulator